MDGIDVQYVIALDKEMGETVWRTDRSTEFGDIDGDFRKAYSTGTVAEFAGRRQLLVTGAKAGMAYDPSTGEELWSVRYDGFSNASRTLFGHGLAYLNTGYGKPQLWAVRPDGQGDVTVSHVVWKHVRNVPAKPTPVLVDGLLFMVDDKGIASCLEAPTGELLWRERLGGKFSASPLHSENRIYVSDEDGTTHVFRAARSFEPLAKNELDAGCMASPAVVGSALLLRTKEALYRLEERD